MSIPRIWLSRFADIRLMAVLVLPASLLAFQMPDTVIPERMHSFSSNTSLEGPAWSVEEQALYFSVQAGDFGTYRWMETDVVKKIQNSIGKVNGNAFDALGRLVVCDSANRQVIRYEKDFSTTVLASEFEGRALNEPNDVIIKSDGTIWFTTPSWSSGELNYQYVLKLDPETGDLTKMVSGIDKPNGLGFSPDESVLYLNDNGANRVLAYSLHPDGSIDAEPTVVLENIARWPDGMAVDEEGNLFVAVYSGSMAGIQILSASGEYIGEIKFFGITDGITNCIFGNPGEHILWVTAKNELYRIDLSAGYPPQAPEVQAEMSGDKLHLSWTSVPDVQYDLYYSTDLENWQAGSVSPQEEAGSVSVFLENWSTLPFWRVLASWK